MRRIVIRVLAAVPAVAIQFAWLLLLARWLAPWAALLNFVLSVLALLFVLYLVIKADETAYSMLWLLVILSFPLPGAFLYLLFGDKRTTRKLRRQLDRVGADFPPAPPRASTSAFCTTTLAAFRPTTAATPGSCSSRASAARRSTRFCF